MVVGVVVVVGGGGGRGVKSFSCQSNLGYVRLSWGWVGVLTTMSNKVIQC